MKRQKEDTVIWPECNLTRDSCIAWAGAIQLLVAALYRSSSSVNITLWWVVWGAAHHLSPPPPLGVVVQRHFTHYWFALGQVFMLASAVCMPPIQTQCRCSHLYVQITVQVCGCVRADVKSVGFLHCDETCSVLGQTVPGEDGEGAVPDRDQRPAGPAVGDARRARLGQEVSRRWRERHHDGGNAQCSLFCHNAVTLSIMFTCQFSAFIKYVCRKPLWKTPTNPNWRHYGINRLNKKTRKGMLYWNISK